MQRGFETGGFMRILGGGRYRPGTRRVWCGLLLLILLCVAAGLLGSAAGHVLRRPSCQADYPVLQKPRVGYKDGLQGMSLRELQMRSEVTAVCTVREVSAPQKLYSFDDTEDSSYSHRIRIRLHVDEVLSGEPESTEILLWQDADTLKYQPKPAYGDRFVLFLKPFYIREGYEVVSNYSGWWHVSWDEKVYPAHVIPQTQDYSGMPLGKFQDAVRTASDPGECG